MSCAIKVLRLDEKTERHEDRDKERYNVMQTHISRKMQYTCDLDLSLYLSVCLSLVFYVIRIDISRSTQPLYRLP